MAPESDQATDDLRQVMATPAGRRFLRRMLADCRTFRGAFEPDSERMTAYRLGVQSVGLGLISDMLQVDPSAYISVINEEIHE